MYRKAFYEGRHVKENKKNQQWMAEDKEEMFQKRQLHNRTKFAGGLMMCEILKWQSFPEG